MVIIRIFFITFAFVLVSGCTTITVLQVNNASEIKHVCIQDGQQICSDGRMLGVIREGFDRHGIATQVYTGNLPSQCEYNLSYMCERSWDFATYLKHAEMRLYKGITQIGYVEYDCGVYSLMKWQSTRTKMDPFIDELLSGRPIQKRGE